VTFLFSVLILQQQTQEVIDAMFEMKVDFSVIRFITTSTTDNAQT